RSLRVLMRRVLDSDMAWCLPAFAAGLERFARCVRSSLSGRKGIGRPTDSPIGSSPHLDDAAAPRLLGLREFQAPGTRAAPRARTSTWRANTTMRWAALYSGWHAVSTRRSYPTARITEYSDGETIRVLSTA